MRIVYKHAISFGGDVTILMPEGSHVRHVGTQGGTVLVWVECDPEKECSVRRQFMVFGTGHEIPEGYVWIGTTHAPPFVWHVYEKGGAQ